MILYNQHAICKTLFLFACWRCLIFFVVWSPCYFRLFASHVICCETNVGKNICCEKPLVFSWNSKQPFINGCLVISNHFPCKDFESSNWNNHKELLGLRVPGSYVFPLTYRGDFIASGNITWTFADAFGCIGSTFVGRSADSECSEGMCWLP